MEKCFFYVKCGHLFAEDVDASRPFLCRMYIIDLSTEGLEPKYCLSCVFVYFRDRHSHGHFHFKKL